MKPETSNAEAALETGSRSRPSGAATWFDAMRENSKAFVEVAMMDCHAGPTWKPVIARILTNAYETGYKARMVAEKQQASNDQAQRPLKGNRE